MGGLEKFEREHVWPQKGLTLICGSKLYGEKEDRRKRFADAVGVDMQEGDGVDVVLNIEDRAPAAWLGSFSHVECMSTLEHCAHPWLAACFIEDVMRPGATIFVSVPWVWRVHGYPDDNFRVSPNGLLTLFPRIEWKVRGLATQRDYWMETRKKYPSLVEGSGDKYLLRSETVGFGVRR